MLQHVGFVYVFIAVAAAAAPINIELALLVKNVVAPVQKQDRLSLLPAA